MLTNGDPYTEDLYLEVNEMKCYHHPDRDAVASCSECGKGLCRECSDRWDPPLCDQCAGGRIQDQRDQVQKLTRLSVILFFVWAILGSILGIGTCISEGTLLRIPLGILQSIMTAYIVAGIPCGWSVLTGITPNIFLILPLIGWVVYFVIKFCLAVFVGVVAFPYRLYQVHKGKKRLAALEAHIRS